MMIILPTTMRIRIVLEMIINHGKDIGNLGSQ